MPRKRKTRAVNSRPKPTIPDGDEGNTLEQETRDEKLRVLREDFEGEAKSKIAQLRGVAKAILQQINNAYSMEYFKIPKKVRDMELPAFLKAGGDVNTAAMANMEQIVQDIASSVQSLTGSGKSRTGKPLNTISEEEENSGTILKQTKAGGRSRKRAAFGQDTSNLAPPPPPPSTAKNMRSMRKTRTAMQTPCNRGGPSAAGWETPLITPKFDPRLPTTPAYTRNPKAGERLVSLAGSPVTNKTLMVQEPEALIPTQAGSINITADLNTEDLDSLVSHIDKQTMDKLRKLQMKLNTVIQYGEQVNSGS